MAIRNQSFSRAGIRELLLASSALIAIATPAAAQDATWLANPTVHGISPSDFNFDARANWSTGSLPIGASAIFGQSTGTAITITAIGNTVTDFTFLPGASDYNFMLSIASVDLEFTGAGIVSNGSRVAIDITGGLSRVTFSNSSSAGNAFITNTASGVAQNVLFRDSSTAGNATITSTGVGASVVFFDNSSGGNARFISNAGGDIDFSALSTSGTTAGSIEGTGTILLGGKNLVVGGNNLSTTFSGVINGAGGSLTKVGAGTLTLDGTNGYTGVTTVNGGTLQVDGSIVSSSGVNVNNGGALGGSGTVGGTTINAGGILAPGSAATNLTISGNLVFQSGALYVVQLNAAGQSSKATVTGNAALNGANVEANFATGIYSKGQSFTILSSSNPISGTFAGVSPNLHNITASLNYDDPLNVKLVLTGVTFTNGNANQRNAANSISNIFNNGGALPASFLNLLALPDPSFGKALTQASGEIAVGSQQTTFAAMNQFLNVLTDPFIAGRGDNPAMGNGASGDANPQALGYAEQQGPGDALAAIDTKAPPRQATFEQRWSVWASGFGGSQTTSGNTALGSNDTTSRIVGTAVGADYRFSPDTIAGFALAGGGTSFSVANGGSGSSDLFQAGAFVRHNAGAAYVSAAIAYGLQFVSDERTLTISGVDRLRADFKANAVSGRIEGGYRLVEPWLGVGFAPYAAGQFTTLALPAYADSVVSGADSFVLAYAAKTVVAARSELGFRTDKSFVMPDGVVTLRGRAGWARDFNTDRNVAATFQALPGASFVVNGAAAGPDAALVSASAERKWLNGFSLAATFEGEFSNISQSYAGKGAVRYQW